MLIRPSIDDLRRYLPYVPPVSVEAIKALHSQRDLGGIVRLIRKTMNVNVHLVLHWTDEVRGDAPAWVSRPKDMPYYGSPEFKKVKVDLFIRKSFAQTEPYDRFAIVVAHEFSHIVLDSLHHPLRGEEKAVDLTAMILGFSDLYQRAARRIKRVGLNQFEENTLGYLSENELDIACQILVPTKFRARHAALKYLWRVKQRAISQLPQMLFLAALAGFIVLGETDNLISNFINSYWEPHAVSNVWKTNKTDHPVDTVRVTNSVGAMESSCIERLRSSRIEITRKQGETFCNCYLEEMGNPPPRLQEKIDLVTRRCSHEAFGE